MSDLVAQLLEVHEYLKDVARCYNDHTRREIVWIVEAPPYVYRLVRLAEIKRKWRAKNAHRLYSTQKRRRP